MESIIRPGFFRGSHVVFLLPTTTSISTFRPGCGSCLTSIVHLYGGAVHVLVWEGVPHPEMLMARYPKMTPTNLKRRRYIFQDPWFLVSLSIFFGCICSTGNPSIWKGGNTFPWKSSRPFTKKSRALAILDYRPLGKQWRFYRVSPKKTTRNVLKLAVLMV